MSRAIVLIDADDADSVSIVKTDHPDDWGGNMVFASVDAADMWIERNAEIGWCTRIVEIDE